MNPVSVGEYHGLRVGAAVLSIVAGCIIIGVSRECDADAVGGIFLGAGGLGECGLSFSGASDTIIRKVMNCNWLFVS